ncbi:MAG: phospho-N-acetylmuramoyl-pentapeptide-transferase [Clostridia bacterium]|nr:phospho-N-acetylmuramoyl-pentapeptide-transferase [Clostridia bacterium]
MGNKGVLLFLLTLVLTCVGTVLISRRLIPYLKSKKMGQKILEIGPRWHKSKEGTPTMGGLAFIAASLIAVAIVAVIALVDGQLETLLPFFTVYGYGLTNGLIGVIDDRAKLRKKQNEGLTAPQKYLLQLIAAALFLIALTLTGVISTSLVIPFAGVTLELGFFYYVIALLLLTGIVNAVNLTDGIDGLASSVTFVVGLFFAAVSYLFTVIDLPSASLGLVSAVLIGSTVGFLVYNFYPARVFMGDTGSLFLGGMVVGGAFLTGTPLLVVICGIIYICEAASVILQVGYFKLTHGKRLFLMAPIHHHFEKCGWSEVKIVCVFSIVTAVFCVLAWFGLTAI